MAFVLTIRVPLATFPNLDELLADLRPAVGRTLRIDDDSQVAAKRGRPESSWCPWPRRNVGFFVPGATTRGTDVTLARSGSGIDVQVVHPVLGTWTDWRIAVEIASTLAERGDAPVRLDPTKAFTPAEIRKRFLSDESRWQAECIAGAEAVREAVARGRTVRLGGPAGTAAVGPRSWSRLCVEPEDDAPAAELLDLIQQSLEARGFETYYPANLLCLDGRSGREIVASLLAPDVPTILRDPEFVLVGDDLEDRSGPSLQVLRFDDLDEALPRRLIWLDDRTCAVPLIRRDEWPELLERMQPWLTRVEDILDAGAATSAPPAADWRGMIPPEDVPDPDEPSGPAEAAHTPTRTGRPDRPWWKFW